MKKNLKSLALNKKLISKLQQLQIYGAESIITTSLNINLCVIRTIVSVLVCPDPDDTIEEPDTNRVCDESVKICV